MQHPTLFKRLLTALYDGFLILACIFIATALTLPFTKGDIESGKNIFMSLYLFGVIYLFYGWFWTHGGQTLGMRAWQQQIVSMDGKAVNWQQAFIRIITALPAWLLFIIGLIFWMKPEFSKTLTSIPGWSFALAGCIWILLDNRNGNWRDKLSGTQIIVVENKK